MGEYIYLGHVSFEAKRFALLFISQLYLWITCTISTIAPKVIEPFLLRRPWGKGVFILSQDAP